MNIPESEHDYAWVSDRLAADVTGPMPSQVSDRVLAALGAAASGSGSSQTSRGARTRGQGTAAVPPAAIPPAADPIGSRRSAAEPSGHEVSTGRIRGTASRADIAHGPPIGPVPDAAEESPAAGATSGGKAGAAVRVLTGGRRSGRAEAESDRRHFLLYRILPVAASMVVIAAASGVVASQLGQEDEPAVVAAEVSAQEGPRPNGLVATGTVYTATELAEQAAGLLTEVAQGRDQAVAPQPAGADATRAGVAAAGAEASSPATAVAEAGSAALDPLTGSPLASAAAFRECARTLGAPEGVLPSAVDLATFEGSEAAIVVLPNRAGDGYEVIVTDRFCSANTERASETFVGG